MATQADVTIAGLRGEMSGLMNGIGLSQNMFNPMSMFMGGFANQMLGCFGFGRY